MSKITKHYLSHVYVLIIIVSAVEALNILTGRSLNQYSIIPRHISTLPFIFSSPFLHANTAHYLSNIIPLSLLSYFALQFGTKRFYLALTNIIILGGILVWLMAREAHHLGASILVYGLFAYIVVGGFRLRSIKLLSIATITLFLYSGLIWGVLPIFTMVSWESHLFGFISGVIAAYNIKKRY